MPAITSYDEISLLACIAKGDEVAFRQLFDHHWDNIYGVAFAFTKSPVIAEEMAQDVFVKIWLRREELPQVRKFNDYLFIIARNHILSTLRKKIIETSFPDHLLNYFRETDSNPEDQLMLRETEHLLHKAIEQLPPQQHLIYCLSREQGLNQEEIAAKLDISKNTVKSHMSKALLFIRNYLRMHAEVEAFAILYCIILGLL
ncbi:RNA polymerase sigma-70 factor [Flavitalea sp. BT771]|uniref:RNA polymerase sigma factor n=1 Tax=Flavitalea sp. BT771 TaxID=3063329 RepID=UPI0026E1D535|nr:RNA polymerase sigma-70 factor [Flavitalea sp. BT771]MDO6432582.1 RNA polymerase sigma-70 factor [Flavitalea sp. BT771]MDV6222142.1 RNA polymerase sigma-70 factor [Flavitalea sp. BT771]